MVGEYLGIDPSPAWRRVLDALTHRYLKNNETRPRQPQDLEPDEPMPDTVELLPKVNDPRLARFRRRLRTKARRL
jgi:hypothetical protein